MCECECWRRFNIATIASKLLTSERTHCPCVREVQPKNARKSDHGMCGVMPARSDLPPKLSCPPLRAVRRALPSVERGRFVHGCHEKPRMPSTRRTSFVKRRESRTGRRSNRASSWGSFVQPSIGIPFAGDPRNVRICQRRFGVRLTFVPNVTYWRVVYETDAGEVLLDDCEVLGVGAIWQLCA